MDTVAVAVSANGGVAIVMIAVLVALILRCRNGTPGGAWAGAVQPVVERTECLGLRMLDCRCCRISACCANRTFWNDKDNGKEIWSQELPAYGSAPLSIY